MQRNILITDLMHDYLVSKGISHDLIAPYSPEQNSVAERDNRTIVECARSMLYQHQIPLHFGAEAINIAVYTLNRISSHVIHGQTLMEKS